jgi:hypothetical protein
VLPALRVPARLAACFLPLLLLTTAGAPRLGAAQAAPPEPAASFSDGVTRDARRAAILQVARAYATHAWRATEANALHGPDADGIHVDTPDASHRADGFRTDGSLNTGVPYKWGGFSSLQDFDAAVAAGMPAGQLTDGVNLDASAYAVGVDCSGFVARCWNLPFKQSTRSLGRLCFALASYDALLPGDLINKFDAHAMVFAGFEDAERSRVRVIEAAFPNVKESVYPVASLEAAGFAASRYKPLDERWVDVGQVPETAALDPEAGEWIAEGEPQTFEVAELAEGVDLRSLFDELLPDGLADAQPGDWVAYRAGHVDGPLALEVTRVVASNTRAQGDGLDGGIQVQTSTALGELSMGTLESHPTSSPWAARMTALEDSGQPLDAMAVRSGSWTSGRWVDGALDLPGMRIELHLQASMTSRGQALPLDVKLVVIVSPRVPLEGLVSWARETAYELPSGPAVSSMRYQLAAFGRGG